MKMKLCELETLVNLILKKTYITLNMSFYNTNYQKCYNLYMSIIDDEDNIEEVIQQATELFDLIFNMPTSVLLEIRNRILKRYYSIEDRIVNYDTNEYISIRPDFINSDVGDILFLNRWSDKISTKEDITFNCNNGYEIINIIIDNNGAKVLQLFPVTGGYYNLYFGSQRRYKKHTIKHLKLKK